MEANTITPETTVKTEVKTPMIKSLVCKVSESGKSMLVGHKFSKYDTGYTFGWCSNPDNLVKGDAVEDFRPKGRVAIEKDNEPVTHEDGSAVMKWVFC